MTSRSLFKATASAVALTAGCGLATTALANDDVLAHIDAGDIVMPSITYNGWNYSPLDQITTDNVGDLTLQWTMLLGADDEYEAAPMVVGDVMYIVHPVTDNGDMANFVSAHSISELGRTLWEFRPDIDTEAARQACCGDQTRGMQYAEGNVYYHTLDGQVFALDGETGEALWRAVGADSTIREHAAGNGIIINDLYIIGNAGGEYGVRGKVSAFDIHSGQTQWVMYSMGPNNEVGIGPRFDPQYAYMQSANPGLDTWFGDSWRRGGGTSWGYFTADLERDMFFYGTGNCGPWNPDYRREWGVLNLDENGGLMDYYNNFCAGTIARDASTGEMIWAYVEVPADPWDLDEPLIHPLIEYEGQDAVVLAARNGWFYVWDRDNGKILNTPWMHTFTDMTMSVNLDTGLPEYNAGNWAFTDLEDRQRYVPDRTFEEALIDPAEYTGTEVYFCPGTSARNWQNDVYNPVTQLLYTVNNTSCGTWRFIEGEYVAGEGYVLRVNAGATPRHWFPENAPVGGTHYDYDNLLNNATEITFEDQLMANNPHTGVQEWVVNFEENNDSPVMGTAGQVLFKGGKHDGTMQAYDAATGDLLWSFRTGSGFEGSAITYMRDGVQYVAVIGSSENSATVDEGDGAGADERFRRGGSALYVFALPTAVAGN